MPTRQAGEDPDAGISMGLFNYPVLMAADILIFNAHEVPVGRDQIQHIEMARDMGQRFNHVYGGEHFTLPEARVEESTALLPGLDGRKMSKSYDNTIPLWLPAQDLRKAIMGIVTNSQAPGEPKDPAASHLYTIYQAFADAGEAEQMRRAYADGIAWGEAKQALYERIDRELAPARERYQELVAHPARIEEVLHAGAAKARARATPFMETLRGAVGLRKLTERVARAAGTSRKGHAGPRFVQYREDGKFRFKLVDADGTTQAVSVPFGDPKAAGEVIRRLPREAEVAAAGIRLDGHEVASVSPDAVATVVALLRELGTGD